MSLLDTSNAIPYWGYYAGQNYFDTDPMQGQPGEEFLAALRKYDPNARFVQTTMGTDGSSPVWTLQYDHSKLPGGGLGGGNVDMNAGDYAPINWSPNDHGETFQDVLRLNPGIGNYQGHLYDPNAISTDPVYGRVTSPSNLNTAADNKSFLDWAGPLAVGAFGLAFGGIPALYDGVFGQGAYGGADLSGLGASDPFLNGGTGAMDMTGSAGTGIPGSFGANAPLGSAESSLFGPGVQTAPETAFGGAPFDATQAAAPIIDRGIPAGVSDVIRNGGIPGLDNIGRSLSGIGLGDIGQFLGKVPGLLTGGQGSGGGGNSLNVSGGGGSRGGNVPVENAASIIAKYYSPQMGLLTDPRLLARQYAT